MRNSQHPTWIGKGLETQRQRIIILGLFCLLAFALGSVHVMGAELGDDSGQEGVNDVNVFTLTIEVLPADEWWGTVDAPRVIMAEDAPDKTIILTATPRKGFILARWEGTDDDTRTGHSNTVTLDADKTVTVVFEKYVRQTYTVPGDFRCIQTAVNMARAGDVIVVDPGVYFSRDTLGYAVTIDKPITLRSMNPDDPCVVSNTIIDGYATINSNQSMLGVLFGRRSSGAVFNGFTIQNCSGKAGQGEDGDRDWENFASIAVEDQTITLEGHPNGGDGGFIMGGGMYIAEGASPIIKNCIIRDCQLEGGDGGNGAAAEARDDRDIFNQPGFNAGRGGWGGFVHGAGAYCAKKSSPRFINCSFENNLARGGNGGNGGDYNKSGGWAGYGGNFSPGHYVDYDPCEAVPTTHEVPLWQVWQWDLYITYLYWNAIWTQSLDALEFTDEKVLAQISDGMPYLGDYRWYSGYGGAVFCDQGSHVQFEGCTMRGNRVAGGQSGVGGIIDCEDKDRNSPALAFELPSYGGAVYAARNARVRFDDCSFVDNLASGPNEVGLRVNPRKDPNTAGDPNFALDPYLGWGGAVAAEETALLEFVNCSFAGNKAHTGGGLYLSYATTEIADCHIFNNSALRGGGLYGRLGEYWIRDCNVINNKAGGRVYGESKPLGYGAGMAFSRSDAQVWDCNFYSNDAHTSGGGLYLRDGNPSILNCLFWQNEAGQQGGGISSDLFSQSTIRNCTFYSNAAWDWNGSGGAVYGGPFSELTIVDSILWQNMADWGSEIATNESLVDVSYSNLWLGSPVSLHEDSLGLIDIGEGMVYTDPHFRDGLLGKFYLQTPVTGDMVLSPCIDAGSTTAGEWGMSLASTQADQVPDVGQVDIGYHHLLREPARFCDLEMDGVIDDYDVNAFFVLQMEWGDQVCTSHNGWCNGVDLNFDGGVDGNDLNLLSAFFGARDVNPPQPNRPEWAQPPMMLRFNQITMVAEPVEDLWGWDVEYQFDCVGNNGNDSGWQASPVYVDVLNDWTQSYEYRFRVREKRPDGHSGNVTRWSESRTANEKSSPPRGFLSLEPNDITAASISVLGEELEHSYGVEYRFQRESRGGGDPGEASPWMQFPAVDAHGVLDPNSSNIPNYRFTGLEQDTDYRIRYQARAAWNSMAVTSWSEWLWVRTTDMGDICAPRPNPMQFAFRDPNGLPGTPEAVLLVPGDTFGWGVTMTASDLAMDWSGGTIEFYYECITDPRFSSDWTTDTTYVVLIGPRPTGLQFRIKARDDSGNETEWSAPHALPPPPES